MLPPLRHGGSTLRLHSKLSNRVYLLHRKSYTVCIHSAYCMGTALKRIVFSVLGTLLLLYRRRTGNHAISNQSWYSSILCSCFIRLFANRLLAFFTLAHPLWLFAQQANRWSNSDCQPSLPFQILACFMVILQILPCFYNEANRTAFRTFKLFQQCFFRENRNPAMFALQVYYLAHAMRLICLNVYNLVHSASPSMLLLRRIRTPRTIRMFYIGCILYKQNQHQSVSCFILYGTVSIFVKIILRLVNVTTALLTLWK